MQHNDDTITGLNVGLARTDLTCWVPSLGMLGWATYGNTSEAVESRIYARAYIFEELADGDRLAWVHVEICFVPVELRLAVLNQLAEHHADLQLTEKNVMITANHTHSCAGGYTQSLLYNLTIPGYCPEIFHYLTARITEAIVAACADLAPARLSLAQGRFEDEWPVAFNRSVEAYNLNPETRHLDWEERHLAVDRNMTLLRIERPDGTPRGVMTWFGVHTTSLHNDLSAVSGDNKGVAGRLFEDYIRQRYGVDESYLAAFAQTTAGDVTPNYLLHPQRPDMRGPTPDDYENMRMNGQLQANKALEIFFKPQTQLGTRVDTLHWYVDLADMEADPEFTHGMRNCRTGPPTFGSTMLLGTEEGGGVPWPAFWMLHQMSVWKGAHNPAIYGERYFMVESETRKFFGFSDLDITQYIPEFVLPGISKLSRLYQEGGFGNRPLSPRIMPIQIAILGELAIVGLPAEPTTVVGLRLRKTLQAALGSIGVHHILIQGYTNGYHGYITTWEEYQKQHYEGAHTVFGQWTCAVYQTLLEEMAFEMRKNPEDRVQQTEHVPELLDDSELYHQRFDVVTGKKIELKH